VALTVLPQKQMYCFGRSDCLYSDLHLGLNYKIMESSLYKYIKKRICILYGIDRARGMYCEISDRGFLVWTKQQRGEVKNRGLIFKYITT
jgi:hypothetical protein